MVDKECPANAVVFTKEDSPIYYCSRVKKVDHVNQRQTLSGSIFENQNNSGYKSADTPWSGSRNSFSAAAPGLFPSPAPFNKCKRNDCSRWISGII